MFGNTSGSNKIQFTPNSYGACRSDLVDSGLKIARDKGFLKTTEKDDWCTRLINLWPLFEEDLFAIVKKDKVINNTLRKNTLEDIIFDCYQLTSLTQSGSCEDVISTKLEKLYSTCLSTLTSTLQVKPFAYRKEWRHVWEPLVPEISSNKVTRYEQAILDEYLNDGMYDRNPSTKTLLQSMLISMRNYCIYLVDGDSTIKKQECHQDYNKTTKDMFATEEYLNCVCDNYR